MKETKITPQELMQYQDGTWILTDRLVTEILGTEHWQEANPKVKGDIREGLWWRRKQLLDHLAMNPDFVEAFNHIMQYQGRR